MARKPANSLREAQAWLGSVLADPAGAAAALGEGLLYGPALLEEQYREDAREAEGGAPFRKQFNFDTQSRKQSRKQ